LYNDLAIFTGRAHPAFAEDICSHLGRSLGAADVFSFSNDNVFVRYQENIRERDVFLVQSFAMPVNTAIMELLIMIDAAKRASAGRVTAVIPYYSYGRSDKKDQPRIPITARLVANLLETAGADRVLTMNLHAGQIQGFFNIPVDELSGISRMATYFSSKDLSNHVVVATDVGDEKRARDLAVRLNLPLAIIDKRRIGNTDITEASNIIGDVGGMDALILDDEINTASTMVEAVNILRKHGAGEIALAGYHAVLSGPAIERLTAANVREIIITDSLPIAPESWMDNMKLIPVASLFGDAIERIHTGQSVGELFS